MIYFLLSVPKDKINKKEKRGNYLDITIMRLWTALPKIINK